MNPPANWYPDPTGRHGQRYWDGEQWTEHVFTDGVQGVDPLETAAVTADAAGDDATSADRGAGVGTEDQGFAAATATETTADAAGDASAAAPTDGGDQPGGDAATPSQGSGLFDAGAAATEPGEEAPDAEPEPEWTPAGDQAAADDAEVAPEVEADDVVGSLDEVAEAADTDPGESPAAGVPDLTQPDGDEVAAADETGDDETGDDETAADETGDDETGDDEAGDDEVSTPAGDFSDAFMVTPETVSRLVSRTATAAPEAEPEQPQADDASAVDTDAAAPAAAPDDGTTTPGDEAGGAIDAPPPSMPDPAPAATAPPTSEAASGEGGLGITGELVSGAFAEREESGPVALQNSRLLRCSLDGSSGVIARQGTMVAYQGDVSFERQGAGGVTRALKRATTGEGLAMMRAEGNGDVFFADGAQHVFLLELAGGPGLSVNGRNVLAFDAGLQWDIERVKGATLLAGGLFNTTLTGTGWVALVSDGEPVVLRTDEAATFVDVNALVAWSSGLTTRITNTVSAKSLVGLGSGEAFQMAFEGNGVVIVQPSEGPMGGAAAS